MSLRCVCKIYVRHLFSDLDLIVVIYLRIFVRHEDPIAFIGEESDLQFSFLIEDHDTGNTKTRSGKLRVLD
jgi:hypothetical protein